MGNIISKMGLYDLFARGVTGIIVLCAAHVFGLVNIEYNEKLVWVFLLGGYFCGLILEELSYLHEKVFRSRERAVEIVCCRQNYRAYDYEKCKSALIADNQELICDEPLSHVIMSSSFRIAFFIILLVEAADAICCCTIITKHLVSPVLDIFILEALILIFHYRANHYIKRRTERIFDFCIAKDIKILRDNP